jgi:hypothetical protein
MAKGYEINEKDIKGTINFLKHTDPEHATPEMAIELLEYLQKNAHTLAHTDLNKLTEIYNELKKTRKSRN